MAQTAGHPLCWLLFVHLQSQLDLLVSAVTGLRQHLQTPGNYLQVDLLLQGPGGVNISPSQDETLKVRGADGRQGELVPYQDGPGCWVCFVQTLPGSSA